MEHVVSDVSLGPFRVEYDTIHRRHLLAQYRNFCFVEPSCPDVRHCLDDVDEHNPSHGYMFSTYFYEPKHLEWRWNNHTRTGAILVNGQPILAFQPGDDPKRRDIFQRLRPVMPGWVAMLVVTMAAIISAKRMGWRTALLSLLALTLMLALTLGTSGPPVTDAPLPPCRPFPTKDLP